MRDCEATFRIDRQPVLPLVDLLSQQKSETIALPIGAKIKSFKIDDVPSPGDRSVKIELPNFADLSSYLPNTQGDRAVGEAFNSCSTQFQGNVRTVKRFWWHWLLLTSQKISILVLLILFQSSTQAKNILENAKIYIDLNSSEATTLPASSRAYLQDSQASPLNRAIRQAREIEADSPFYAEAQEDIDRWSETILDIARGRAGEQDFAGAIAAAKLVPQNNSSTELIAQQATEAVENWQLQAQRNDLYRSYLQQAQISLDPRRASSYNQAIAILKKIAPGAKEYAEAQHLIERWNEKIYLIAEERAAQGDFKQATEAAVLVSEDSLYHQLAKDSIETKIKSIYGVCN
jgi:hypothetical protein